MYAQHEFLLVFRLHILHLNVYYNMCASIYVQIYALTITLLVLKIKIHITVNILTVKTSFKSLNIVTVGNL